jgi:hypothetical protein
MLDGTSGWLFGPGDLHGTLTGSQRAADVLRPLREDLDHEGRLQPASVLNNLAAGQPERAMGRSFASKASLHSLQQRFTFPA